jgi:hypothetical protein
MMMGDRANIVIVEQGERVYLYSHWGGYSAPETLRAALARKQRWDDPAYLTRIIFCTMVSGHEKDETGYGISTRIQDNEYPLLIVDTDKQSVRLEATPSGEDAPSPQARTFSFAEFAALPHASWDDLDPTREESS